MRAAPLAPVVVEQAAALRLTGLTWKAVARQLRINDVNLETLRSAAARHARLGVKQPETVVMSSLRFRREHHEVLAREASAHGMTVAGWLREIVRRHVEANAAEEATQ